MYKLMSKLPEEVKFMWHDGEYYRTREQANMAACNIEEKFQVKVIKSSSHGKNRLHIRFPRPKN